MTLRAERSAVHPCFLEPPLIPGLPEHLQDVPTGADEWRGWQRRIAAYRELTRRDMKTNMQQRDVQEELCRRDPVYFMAMFGVLLEPRDVEGRSAEWVPFIPFAFQVQLVRWIQQVMREDDLGRGDGIVEKSREMGATWLFCLYIVWAWLYEPVFICGVISRNEEAVDATGKTDTIFSKIRAQLGLERGIPANLKFPEWMLPDGFKPSIHSRLRTLNHPTRTNIVQGETTTELSGVGGRATMRLNDEAARFREAGHAWGNQQAVSFHRFAVSSADATSGMWFHNLARRGEKALSHPHEPGPSFARLDYWLHPFHTDEWYANERARAEDQAVFDREYGIDYFAGQGDWVYPRASDIEVGEYPYDPRLGGLDCVIDPGVADPTSIVFMQEDPLPRRFRCVEAFENDGSEDAEFMASVLVGIPISGAGYDYEKYPGLLEMMDWLYNLRRPITFYGDPYGNHRGGDGKRSYFQTLAEKSKELTRGARTIQVRTMTKDEARTHFVRKNSLNQLLSRLDFHDAPGPRWVLTCLQRSKYPQQREASNRTVERLEPRHDEYSHARSGIEFWANHIIDLERVMPTTQTSRAPVRQTMSGRRR